MGNREYTMYERTLTLLGIDSKQAGPTIFWPLSGWDRMFNIFPNH